MELRVGLDDPCECLPDYTIWYIIWFYKSMTLWEVAFIKRINPFSCSVVLSVVCVFQQHTPYNIGGFPEVLTVIKKKCWEKLVSDEWDTKGRFLTRKARSKSNKSSNRTLQIELQKHIFFNIVSVFYVSRVDFSANYKNPFFLHVPINNFQAQ